jgi:hypothetical protein
MPVTGGYDNSNDISEKYGFFVRGRNLVLIEWRADGSITKVNEPEYQAPSKSITNGLMIEYTAIPDISDLNNSSDDIPIPDQIALALVDYIKAQLMDRPEQMEAREFLLKNFKSKVLKYYDGRVGGLRKVLGTDFLR